MPSCHFGDIAEALEVVLEDGTAAAELGFPHSSYESVAAEAVVVGIGWDAGNEWELVRGDL